MLDTTYRKLLAPAGWSTNMTQPVKNELDYVVIYSHPTEGNIRLEMRPGEGSLRVAATYQTREEVETEKAKAAAQGDALKAKLAAEANAPLPELSVSLPGGTTEHLKTPGGLAFKLKPGMAMAGAQKISAEFQAQGWKDARPIPLDRATGIIELTRENLRLTILYMDPGAIPAEITITAPKVILKVRQGSSK